MLIVLCGYMGSGKSLIGRKLAAEWDCIFMDLDDEIEKQEGMEIARIFAKKGEIAFRKIEMEVLKNKLKNQKNTILALGGGTPCYGNNLQHIKDNPNTTLIYLKVNAKTLTDRLFSEKDKRPLLHQMNTKEKLNEYIRKHLFERQFYYLQSDYNLEVSDQTPTEIVAKISALVD